MKGIERELDRYSELSQMCEAKGIVLHDFLLWQVSENLRWIAELMEEQKDNDTFRMFHGK